MRWVKIIFCLIIGAVAFYYGLKLLRLYFKVNGWEKTKATIINKAVVPKRLTSAGRTTKALSIDYTYSYNNTVYKNNKVFLTDLLNGETGFTQQTGEKFLSEIGNEAEIFVNPKDPNQSVIFCDGLFLYLFAFISGIILLLVGGVYLIRSF